MLTSKREEEQRQIQSQIADAETELLRRLKTGEGWSVSGAQSAWSSSLLLYAFVSVGGAYSSLGGPPAKLFRHRKKGGFDFDAIEAEVLKRRAAREKRMDDAESRDAARRNTDAFIATLGDYPAGVSVSEIRADRHTPSLVHFALTVTPSQAERLMAFLRTL